jgi:DNA replication protein
MNKVYTILNDKSYNFTTNMVKALNGQVSLNEFLVLIYLINDQNKIFDAETISNNFNIPIQEIMEAFNSLINDNLITLKPSTDSEGRISDTVSLDNFFQLIDKNITDKINNSNKKTIFDKIEEEFGRKLSPIECEIVNGWLDTGTSEELISGALKEAAYNGVKQLRYIDKILYEWGKKGFKTMNDVNNHLHNKDEKETTPELFDYDWLDDDE